MWIGSHDGSLVNIEKYHKIDSAKTNNGYEIRAWYDDSRSILATYEKEQQVTEAMIAIFSGMVKGYKAITMPYYITD